MKGPLLSSYHLHPELMLALDAATAQAREWQQDYLGVEHLLLGILETENPDGPGHTSLSLLGVTPEMVLEKLMPAASKATDRRVPRAIPFTPRSLLVLDSAAKLARKEKRTLVDAGHVLRAILDERESLAGWAIAGVCADHVTALSPVLPPQHRDFMEWLLVAHGAAWEFPHDAESGILAAVRQCGRLYPEPPDLTLVAQTFAVHRWFAAVRLDALHHDKTIRLLVSPGAIIEVPWRPRHHKLAAAVSRCLAGVPGAVRIGRRSLLSAWPVTPHDFAGSLDRSRFAGRSPAGTLREWEARDEAASLTLFRLLEQSRQIPSGHLPQYLGCLRDPEGLSLVMEQDGALAGTATALVRAGEIGSGQSPPPGLSLAFGLVLPAYQGRSCGLTLIAARLWLAAHLQRKHVHLEATARSRPWLARLGFRFVLHEMETGTFFHGALSLNENDGDFLAAWLGPENTALLRRLAAKFLEETTSNPPVLCS